MLDEEDENTITWTYWTPAKLNSEKSKELQLSDSENELLSLTDVQSALNTSMFNTSERNVKHRNVNKASKSNTKNGKNNKACSDIMISKLELTELLKKKTKLEIAVLEKQLKKEQLQIEIFEKQL